MQKFDGGGLVALTALTMVAFAANSVLARWALAGGQADVTTFSVIRVISGAAMLMLLARGAAFKSGSWSGALSLLGYVGGFTLAYAALPSGPGALILFVAVQLTMVGAGLRAGESLSVQLAIGMTVAIMGLVFLLGKGMSSPPALWALVAMVGAGVSWGIYSLIGRGSEDPVAGTAGNFLRASMLLVPMVLIALPLGKIAAPSAQGWGVAIVSGALTSGLGYALWYRVLPQLSAMTAGVAQLTVPAVAAIGGAALIGEPLTLEMIGAGLVVLLGVGVATLKTR